MGEQVQRIDQFRLLLNEISHELTEENLQSLIHIYGVPGSMQQNITTGLKLFDFLITQDFISREKIGNLRNLMRKVRPKRRDLVHLVDKYIQKEFETNNVRSVLDDFSESWEQVPHPTGGSPLTISPDEEAVCKVDCAYLRCVCRRVPSFYAPLIILLFLAIISTALFWYADVPEITEAINSNQSLKNAGVYILILEILALVVVLVVCFRKKCVGMCTACCKPEYTVLNNPCIQEESSQQTVRSSSTSATLQTRQASAPRPYRVSEGSESAVFSSYNSVDPNSMSTVGTTDESRSADDLAPRAAARKTNSDYNLKTSPT